MFMLSLDNTGETTVFKEFSGEGIDTTAQTLGFSIKALEHQGSRLSFWDAEQESLRS